MLKTINGHRYDSDTPVLGRWDNGKHPEDSTYFAEELHHNKSGFFFLHCSGGAMSPYAKLHKNGSRTCGETIQPLSNDDARHWVSSKLGEDAYNRIFVGQTSGTETIKLTVLVPVGVATQIDKTAEALGCSRAKMLRVLIDKGLDCSAQEM